jgi:hypothetical protein
MKKHQNLKLLNVKWFQKKFILSDRIKKIINVSIHKFIKFHFIKTI